MSDEAVIDEPTAVTAPPPRSSHFDTLVKEIEDRMAPTPPEQKDEPPPQTPQKPPQQSTPANDDKTFTSPKAADWKKLKGERDEWQKKATEHETAIKTHTEKLAAVEKEYAEYKTKTVDPKEIDEIRKANESLNAQLQRHALSETPKFKSHYGNRFEAATARALDTVGKDKADQIKAVLEAPNSAWRKGILNEILMGMDTELDKLNLIAAVNEYDRTRDERNKELDNHSANLRELKAREQAEQQQAAERQLNNRKAILAEALKEAEKFDAFKTGDDAEHNLQVAKNKKLVEDFVMGGNIPDSVVLMLPVLAAEGERLQKVTSTQAAKITELEEALKKYQGAEPTLEGQGQETKEGQQRVKGYVDEIMERLGPGAGQQRQR